LEDGFELGWFVFGGNWGSEWVGWVWFGVLGREVGGWIWIGGIWFGVIGRGVVGGFECVGVLGGVVGGWIWIGGIWFGVIGRGVVGGFEVVLGGGVWFGISGRRDVGGFEVVLVCGVSCFSPSITSGNILTFSLSNMRVKQGFIISSKLVVIDIGLIVFGITILEFLIVEILNV